MYINTQQIDSGRELPYDEHLRYHFIKSLGADTVCYNWTLPYMCSLFGFMKKWLQEEGVSVDSTMIYDTNTIDQKENIFSVVDCVFYKFVFHPMTVKDSMCESNFLLHETDPRNLIRFINCITYHFMTKVGAKDSCFNDQVKFDINALLSKDRLFHNFMADTLDAGNTCQATNDTVTLSADNCDWYIKFIKDYQTESTCTYNTQRFDTTPINSYRDCLHYRFMKSLGADSVCQVSLIEKCDWYYNMVQSLVPTCICACGLIGNLLPLCMLGSGAVETPIAYQLLWLAGVDITFILTWWIVEVLPEILRYYSEKYALTAYQNSIVSVMFVCLRPLANVARSCTVWLTVLIGLYRYQVVCKPYNSLTSHCKQHGHKYVVLVVILSFLYNIPYFCEYYLHRLESGYFNYARTGLVNKEMLDIYSRIHAAVIVSLPCLILFFATVSILLKLKKLKQRRSSMQTSQTSQDSITVMLVAILILFITCQLPYFVWSGFGGDIRNPDLDDSLGWLNEKKKIQGCGSFMFYMRRLVDAGLLLNSSANGFIYFLLNKTFREALFSRCPCRRDEGTEMTEMRTVSTRKTPDDTDPSC